MASQTATPTRSHVNSALMRAGEKPSGSRITFVCTSPNTPSSSNSIRSPAMPHGAVQTQLQSLGQTTPQATQHKTMFTSTSAGSSGGNIRIITPGGNKIFKATVLSTRILSVYII